MPEVAKMLWGEPNKHLSTRQELRWGKQGSKSVRVDKGAWFDNEVNEGGGVLDLVARETGCKGREAVRWLAEAGFAVDERPEPTKQESRPRPTETPAKGKQDGLPPGVPQNAVLAKTYDYTDEAGTLRFQVCRYEYEEGGVRKKTFRQRRPFAEGSKEWVWSVKGVEQVPYRLTELIEATAQDVLVFVVEGEKDAENLAAKGIPATCNAMGAGKWPDELCEWFKGADVVILPDNDEPGRKHRDLVGSKLATVARRVRVLDIPGLPEKGDVTDWIDAGNDPASLYDLVEARAKVWTPESAWRSHFNALPWANLDDPGPEHEWLIKGLLTRGERSMCAGESQAGKSFFTLDIALSIARGVDFFGLRTMKGGVIYQAGEGGRGIKKRLRAYRQFHGIARDADLPFVLLPSPVDLYGNEDQTNLLMEEIRHWSKTFTVPLELVVIDTLSAATPGANENTSEDMSVVLARCARIAEECRCHVMIVHHMNAGGAKPRGHTSIFANLDNVITIRKLEGNSDLDERLVREATVTKQKDGEDGKSIKFVLKKVLLGKDTEGDEISSCVIVPPNRGRMAEVDLATVDPSIKLSPQCESFLRAIYKAIEDHGETPPPSLELPASLKVVRGEKVRAAFEAMTFEADGETDPEKKAAKIRQAMKRHGEWLMSRQIIGRVSPFIWLTGKRVRGFRRPGDASPVEPQADAEGSNVVPFGKQIDLSDFPG
jgi:hypothetical protein